MPFSFRNLFLVSVVYQCLALPICIGQIDVTQLLDQRQYRTAQELLRKQAFQCLADKDSACAFDHFVRIPEIEVYETWEAYSFPEVKIKQDLNWALSFIQDTIYPLMGEQIDKHPSIKYRLLMVEGICLDANNQLLEAIGRLEQCRRLVSTEYGQNSIQMATVLEWLGTNYAFNIERSTEARDLLQTAYEILNESDHRDSLKMRAHILYGLAYVSGKLYQSEQARSYIDETRDIYRILGLPKEVSHCDNILGEYYMLNGQLDSARNAYQRSLEQMQALGVPANMVVPHINLANWYLGSSDNKHSAFKALHHLQEANSIYFNTPGIQVNAQIDAWLPTNFARYYFQQGKTEKALEYIDGSVALAFDRLGAKHPTTASLLSQAAKEFAKQGMYEDALQYCNLMEGAILEGKGLDQKTDNSRGSTQDSIFSLIQYWFVKGSVLYQQGKSRNDDTEILDAALQCFETGNRSLRDARSMLRGEESKANLAAQFARYFHQAIDVGYTLYQATGDKKYLPVCFELMEANKYLSVFDAAQQASFKTLDEDQLQKLVRQTDSVEFRLKELKRLLSKAPQGSDRIQPWKKERSELEYQREKLNNSLNTIYPDYLNLTYDSVFISIETVQQKLPEKSQLIEFLATDAYYFALSISSTDYDLIRVARSDSMNIDDSLDTLISMLRSNEVFMSDRDVRFYEEHAYSIYKQLISPIVKAEQLIIVPDGKLMYLPIEVVVQSRSSEKNSFESLDYLIRDHAVSYALSSNLLFSDWTSGNQSIEKAAAFAYTDINDPGQGTTDRGNPFPALMFADQEVSEVANFFGSNCKKYVGSAARKAAFINELTRAELIHLAIHGQADVDNLENSRLVFPGDKGQPESMFSYELYPHEVSAKMVVLSACESGLGKNLAGEGLFSMARAFIYAGCPSVVMSLWNVNDRAGFEIIRGFYAELNELQPVSSAMQQAKLKYLNSNSGFDAFPRYWGAITLTGVDHKFKLHQATSGITKTIVFGILGLGILIIIVRRVRKTLAS